MRWYHLGGACASTPRVFEPRYRALVKDVLAGGREFGVTLISRGHEVGGGDQRTDVGTVARVLQAEALDDGRWLVLAVGIERLRVQRWLPDGCGPRLRLLDELLADLEQTYAFRLATDP